jgi:hypothetical protein
MAKRLEELVKLIRQRAGRSLQHQGLQEQDSETARLELNPVEDTDAMPVGGELPIYQKNHTISCSAMVRSSVYENPLHLFNLLAPSSAILLDS